MPDATDIQIAVCGSAGDGTIAAGDILRRAMAEAGYKVISFDLYPPEIRGFGKCVSRLRVTTDQVYSLKQQSDVLISLDDSHAIPHVGEVRDFGAVIYESNPIAALREGGHISAHIRPGQIPYGFACRDMTEKTTGANRSRNIVVVGYVAGLYGMPAEPFERIVAGKFQRKGAAVVEPNLAAFRAGYEAGAASFKLDDLRFGAPKANGGNGTVVAMLNGNQAVVRGLLDAGIQCFFGYPITPATTIMERLAAEMPKRGARLVQTEDEISAIAATIGAGFAGARAATATSGPGLALMSEMMGLGIMAEVPCVVLVSQRGGPSTGMPTKTEQSDLHMAVWGTPGDAPRIVLAPTNVEGCYRLAYKAFEVAELYQVPVIVLLDLYLSNRYETVTLPKRPAFSPERLKRFQTSNDGAPYRRFALVEDGVSPRAVPGEEAGMHIVTGLEHNELGRPSDSAEMHTAMCGKRRHKLDSFVDFDEFTILKRFGDEGEVEVGLLAWGSTFGECLDAMFQAQAEGIRCAAMKVVALSPFPAAKVAAFMDQCGAVLVPELNHEGQFANLLQANLGRPVVRLDQVPGVPMQASDILAEIRRLAGRDGKAAAENEPAAPKPKAKRRRGKAVVS